MKIVYRNDKDIPVWRKEWFRALSWDDQKVLFMNMSGEEFKAEETKLDLCQRIQEDGESKEEYIAAMWADIDYEQSFICLWYQDEESTKRFEEMVDSVNQILSDAGLVCSSATPAANDNYVRIEFETIVIEEI